MEGHYESPQRVKIVYSYLKEKGFVFIKPKIANENDLLLVHEKELIDKVKANTFFDPDTPNLDNIFQYALLACGSAIDAMRLCKKEFTFSLMRPPGHHASKTNVGGFCYFNNIAVSVAKAIKDGNASKIAILDIDAHHGNGTQDIFLGSKEVLYVSIHQAFIYPGTGMESIGNCINYPLPAGTKDKAYIATLSKALDKIKKFEPDMLALSLGFDTFIEDPLTGFMLTSDAYRKIGKIIASLNINTFAVLEGGYSKKMDICVYNFLEGMEKG